MWQEQRWGSKFVAADRIARGQLVMTRVPLLMLTHLSSGGVNKMRPWQKTNLFAGIAEAAAAFDDAKNEAEWTKPYASCYDDPELFSGEDAAQFTPTGRLALMLLFTKHYLVPTHFFSNKATGTREESNEVKKVTTSCGWMKVTWISMQIRDYVIAHTAKTVPSTEELFTQEFVTDAYDMVVMNMLMLSENVMKRMPMAYVFDPVLAMFNHSCNPNVSVVFSEGTVKLFATRTIEPGEELRICYIFGNSWMLHHHTRRLLLLQERHFVCSCERCAHEITTKRVYLEDEYEVQAPAAALLVEEQELVLTPDEKEKRDIYIRHNKMINPHRSVEDLEKNFGNLVIKNRSMGNKERKQELKNSFRSRAIPKDVLNLLESFEVVKSDVNVKRFLMELVDSHRILTVKADAAAHHARRSNTLVYMMDDNWPLLGAVLTTIIRYELGRQVRAQYPTLLMHTSRRTICCIWRRARRRNAKRLGPTMWKTPAWAAMEFGPTTSTFWICCSTSGATTSAWRRSSTARSTRSSRCSTLCTSRCWCILTRRASPS